MRHDAVVRLHGYVASGKGDLTFWMERQRAAYERVTGEPLIPGSLNVVLEGRWVVETPPVRLEPPEVGVGMNIVPCEIEGIRAFVLRTDRNNSGTGDHPTTVLEIAASVHLRQALGLRDGDRVEVVIPD
jgi:riboflavin kinase, archaea type